MLIILGHFEVEASELANLAQPMADVMAETAKEAGCRRYSFAVEHPGDASRHARVALSEIWDSPEALQAHMHAPHLKAFQAVFWPAIRGADIKIYDGANERPLRPS